MSDERTVYVIAKAFDGAFMHLTTDGSFVADPNEAMWLTDLDFARLKAAECVGVVAVFTPEQE